MKFLSIILLVYFHIALLIGLSNTSNTRKKMIMENHSLNNNQLKAETQSKTESNKELTFLNDLIENKFIKIRVNILNQNESNVKFTDYLQISVNDDDLTLSSSSSTDGSMVAEVKYNRSLQTKGWHKLSAKTTNSNIDPFLSMYLAGYLEGRISAIDINDFYSNLSSNNKDDSYSRESFQLLLEFFSRVVKGLNVKISNFNSIEPKLKNYYFQCFYFYAQLLGVVNGYNAARANDGIRVNSMNIQDFLILQADGEINELMRI